MNSPWTIKVIVVFVALGTAFSVIKTLMLFPYFSFYARTETDLYSSYVLGGCPGRILSCAAAAW